MIRLAWSQTSLAETTKVAPAPSYARSFRPLPPPAPFSIRTLWPRAVKAATPVGVTATRLSSVLISFGTPTTMRSKYVKACRQSTWKKTINFNRKERVEHREEKEGKTDFHHEVSEPPPLSSPAHPRGGG